MDFTTVTTNLEKRGYGVKSFDTAEAAADYLDGQIVDKTVGFGGSVTLERMGLFDRLALRNEVFYHNRLPGGVTPNEIRKEAATAEIYLSSVNALAETGEIVNIDGVGNRVASISFGHEKVYLVVGENKITPDFDTALWRARNIAAPKNAQRLKAKTPCAVKGDKCYECESPGRLCRAVSILWAPPLKSDFEVVLIHEELGF
ncbi:MAG: lactate utilization protein [Selenomonadaceae bacterium]|nr:lactate utilization protein [Selenomonadaceae bacterium]